MRCYLGGSQDSLQEVMKISKIFFDQILLPWQETFAWISQEPLKVIQ